MRSDICFILEGTWPYVAGGVSTWVQQLIEGMPDLQFSVLYLGPERDAPRTPKYPIPPNVVEIREVFLQDYGHAPSAGVARSTLSNEAWAAIDRAQRAIVAGEAPDVRELCPHLEQIPDIDDLVLNLAHSKTGWDYAVQLYRDTAPPGTAFLTWFWTHRFIHVPLFNLLRQELPRARLYHAACTGYAGIMGAKASRLMRKPFILTEHGIYQRERRIEIFNAAWIQDGARRDYLDLRGSQSVLKEWWNRLFRSLSQSAYRAADRTTTLFAANQRDQRAEGVPAERSAIIPNGIDVERFARLTPHRRTRDDVFTIGFIGRVTRIKDLKTLIQALAILRDRAVTAQTFVIGPTDEEEGYVGECRELVVALGLNDRVTFTGRIDVLGFLPRLDAVVLTSLSEGQPFVILEANCAGIPVVATDVGGCREMLMGLSPEDQALGESGLITPVASPQATASALERLAKDPDFSARLGDAGRARVLTHYDLRDVIHRYRELYESFLYAGAESRVRTAQRPGMPDDISGAQSILPGLPILRGSAERGR